MLSDIQIIQTNGIPLYSLVDADNQHVINAGFFAAIANYAVELNKGKLQKITFEKRQFLLRQIGNVLFVFANDENQISEYEDKITKVTDNFIQNLGFENIDSAESHLETYEQALNAFDADLKLMQLIATEKEYNAHNNVSQIKKLIYSSVGYTPGKCNIGKTEKMKRLATGLFSLLISAVLFTLMLAFSVPPIYRWLLVIPNIAGVLGILQYRTNFCVYNAITAQYAME